MIAPRLQSSTVVLRVPRDDDAERLAAFQRTNRARFADLGTQPPEEFYTSDWWLRRIAALEEQRRAERLLYLVAAPADEPAVIAGVVSFTHITFAPSYACMLGAAVDARYEGRGLMRESIALAITHVFGAMNLHRIGAEYAVSNERSARLLARLNFRNEGLLRQYKRHDGKWQDYVAAALLNERWRAPE